MSRPILRQNCKNYLVMSRLRTWLRELLNKYFSKNSLPYWGVLMIDSLLCYISGVFVLWSVYGSKALLNFEALSLTILVYMIYCLIGFRMFHTYSGIIRYSTFSDLKRVGYAMLVSFIIAFIMHYPIYFLPLEKYARLTGKRIILMYFMATVMMWIFRIIVKTVYEIVFSSKNGTRTLIYGVLDGGVSLAKSIRNDRESNYILKGFISPEAIKSDKILMGERVYAVNEDLPHVLETLNIQTVLVSPLRNDLFRNDQTLQNYLIQAGVKIYMGAQLQEWDGDTSYALHQLKPISIEDLLPRDEINVDLVSVGNMLTGRRILITGSAGSIGSELVQQIAAYSPTEMILIDQAETPQHSLFLNIKAKWPFLNIHVVLTSILNQTRMEHIFKTHRPDYVFHAAAYKHVPMMENNPSESIQNNIHGTKIVADLSVKYNVKKFVMISTDKAVNPTNVMGCSKRICEIYVQSLDKAIKDGKVLGNTQFVTTRFGNVLGSNGSVIPLFEKQIREGGPVTVTDPNIIRYFMLIPEACKLVLEAGTHGSGGEIFVFDMGQPVRIADLAQRMISLSNAKDVEIVYTGLREGEKLYEEVLNDQETTVPSFHEKIRIAMVREYDYQKVEEDVEKLLDISDSLDAMAMVRKMKDIVPEFISNNSVYAELDAKTVS